MTGSHNVLFSGLQDKYFETGDKKYLGEMYLVCVELAERYIAKYARQRGLRLDVKDLAHDSATYVIDRYLKDTGFRISHISAYIHFGCVKTLFRDKEWDQIKTPYEDCRDYPYEETEGHPEENEGHTTVHPAAIMSRSAASIACREKENNPVWKQGLLFVEEVT